MIISGYACCNRHEDDSSSRDLICCGFFLFHWPLHTHTHTHTDTNTHTHIDFYAVLLHHFIKATIVTNKIIENAVSDSWGGGYASGQKIKVSSLLPEVDFFSLGGYSDKSRLKKPRK